ncbi:hypothetical protein BJY00DRAFT_315570 [Aspergillus carlsbadensis]|nr:hypothetical protein BJY00DRAFT_315570 [Aspergillus carlsbadensis]
MAVPGRADVPWTLDEKRSLLRLRFQHRALSWPEFYALNLFPGRSLPSIQGLWHRHGEPMILFRERTSITELEAALGAEDEEPHTEEPGTHEAEEEQGIHNTRSRKKRTRGQSGVDPENGNSTGGLNKRRRVNPSGSPRAFASSPTSAESSSQPHHSVHRTPEDYTFFMHIGPNATVPAPRTTRSSARRAAAEPIAPQMRGSAETFNQPPQNGLHLEISDAGPLEPVSNQPQMSAYGPQHDYPAYSATNVESWLSNTVPAEGIHHDYPDPDQNILSYIFPETLGTPSTGHTQPDFEPQSVQATQATVQTTEPEHPTTVVREGAAGGEQNTPGATTDVESASNKLHQIHNQQAIQFHRLQIQIGELIEQATVARRLSNRAGQMLGTLRQSGGLNAREMEELTKAADTNNSGRSQ